MKVQLFSIALIVKGLSSMSFRYNCKVKLLFSFLFLQFTFSNAQQLALPSIFSDNMVLQRDTTVVVGWSKPNENVTISIAGKNIAVQADNQGKWRGVLYGIAVGGPYELKVDTKAESKIFNGVLMGDVWFASGQSNMQWRLSSVEGWEEEKKNATINNIRLFHAKFTPAGKPVENLEDHQWKMCKPENLEEFSGVAYFFSKYLQKAQNIPIGIILSSQGGSRIETWMSANSLEKSKVAHDKIMTYEEFRDLKKQNDLDWAYREEIFEKVNVGERLGVHKLDFDDSDWKEVQCPQNWKDNELLGSGYVWLRKRILIEDKKALGDTCKIYFGRIIHGHKSYLNGKELETLGSYHERNFHFLIPTSDLEEGENVLVVRLIRYWGTAGGFVEDESKFGLFKKGEAEMKISLAGKWKYHNKIEPEYPETTIFHHLPTLLFNGMIAPFTDLQVKGFLWYQGESNANINAEGYEDLLKAMITDWRSEFQVPDAPFLVVQLPNFTKYKPKPSDDNWPRLRESQANAQALSNVHLTTIIDLGNPDDIHPRNKKDVGFRLAQVALKEVYDKKLVHTGPSFKSVAFKGKNAILTFENIGSGLMSKDGKAIREFTLAGEDGKFYRASAKIVGGKTIKVSTDKVKKPVAVRYAWQSNPMVNLFNKEGFPATPFRTDKYEQKKE